MHDPKARRIAHPIPRRQRREDERVRRIVRRAARRAGCLIAYDNVSNAFSSANVNTLSFNHTAGTLTNGCVFVGVTYYSSGKNVTGITYDGAPMTLFRRYNNGSVAATGEIWYLVNPPSGTKAVVITMNALTGTGSGIGGIALTLSGVDQTTPIETLFTERTVTGTHSTQSDALTPVNADAWILALITCSSTTAPTVAGTGQVAYGAQSRAVENHADGFGLQGPINPVASTTSVWNWTSSSAASTQIVVAVKPAVTTTKTIRPPRLNGLGSNPLG